MFNHQLIGGGVYYQWRSLHAAEHVCVAVNWGLLHSPPLTQHIIFLINKGCKIVILENSVEIKNYDEI